jgi:hypothetical protein
MKLLRVLRMIRDGSLRIHFSQYGEDVMLHKLFGSKFADGFYIDVGAHHPFRQSNTAYLWLLGWRGVNVDASKAAIDIFRRVRRDDVNLWSAVVDDETAARQSEIELFSNKEIDLGATCKPDLAEQRGTKFSVRVPCTSLTNIINTYGELNSGVIHLLNIDIEGFDEAAVASIHNWRYKPQLILVEIYEKNLRRVFEGETCKRLESAGYILLQRVGLTCFFKLTESVNQ